MTDFPEHDFMGFVDPQSRISKPSRVVRRHIESIYHQHKMDTWMYFWSRYTHQLRLHVLDIITVKAREGASVTPMFLWFVQSAKNTGAGGNACYVEGKARGRGAMMTSD